MKCLFVFLSFLLLTRKTIVHACESKKMFNILLIIVDDLRPLADQNVSLVNIRKMEEKGVSFKNAFAQQALCAPSRNSLLTGRRPDTLHLYDFYSYWRKTVGNFSTLPQFFKENGYETYSVGKVFHPGPSSNYKDDFPYSWSKYPYHPPTNKYRNSAVCKDPTTKKLQNNLICPITVRNQPGNSLPDLQSLDYAVNLLKQKRNSTKPFLLAVGFHKPHIPFKFPKSYLEKVPLNSVQPPLFPSVPSGLPSVAWQGWTDIRDRDDIKRLNIKFPFGVMPKDWTIRIRRSYYAAALFVDKLIGKLLRHVDLRKTIVVLTSDHGWSLGENGLWAKYSNFDVALRVPLIFNIPKMKPKLIHTPVELLDVFPTLVELSGLPNNITKCNSSEKSTLCFEGRSLLRFMKKGALNESFAISQYPRPSKLPQVSSDRPRLKDIKIMGYSIRTKRYRYTEWISFNNKLFTRNWNKIYGVELYDHVTDPEESDNLYLKLEYEDIRQYLSNLLRLHVDHKSDLGFSFTTNKLGTPYKLMNV